MKESKRLWIATAALTIIAGLILVSASRAECIWCPAYTCFGANSCGGDCVCLIPGGEVKGRCVSLGALPVVNDEVRK